MTEQEQTKVCELVEAYEEHLKVVFEAIDKEAFIKDEYGQIHPNLPTSQFLGRNARKIHELKKELNLNKE